MSVADGYAIDTGQPHSNIRNRVVPEVVAKEEKTAMGFRLEAVHLPPYQFGAGGQQMMASGMPHARGVAKPVPRPIDGNVRAGPQKLDDKAGEDQGPHGRLLGNDQ